MEWTAYRQKDDKLKFVQADNQKEAIRKAVNKYNIVPETTNDVRPRTGDAKLMNQKEFNEFMSTKNEY